MGLRADRRIKREEVTKANEKIFPTGKTFLPPELIYKHCISCEHHAEFKISYRKWRDVYKSNCKLKCRKPYEIERDPCSSAKDILKGNPDIKEDCICLAFLMMDADIQGMYGGIK